MTNKKTVTATDRAPRALRSRLLCIALSLITKPIDRGTQKTHAYHEGWFYIWYMMVEIQTVIVSYHLAVLYLDNSPSAGAFIVLLSRLFSSWSLVTAVTSSADSDRHCSSIASISYNTY